MSKPVSRHGAYILVVDDEIETVRVLKRSLQAYGYTVFTATSGEEALDVISRQRPDLILLDLILPEMSGLQVCQRVRAESNVPIIVLSVKDAEREKVRVLDAGADDYIPKPFGMDEVLARVRVALRHVANAQSGTEPSMQIGPLLVDFALRRVLVEGQERQLSPTEYDLLKVFITHRGKILTRQMLLSQVWGVWGEAADAKAHSLHVYIGQLRRKIEPMPEEPQFILTVPGVGYRFADEMDR